MSVLSHSIQVVNVLEDHSYYLDEQLLEQVLLKKEFKDLPVVVVSVAGAYRGGKSFLLNFFIRYLSSPQEAQQDDSWLGENSEPLVGFSWRGGAQRNTTGILIWSEPFVTMLPSGEKVAIILMDTQGTFDTKSTVRDNSTIFALSTLLSSVQIYNLSMNIKEDDMQHLQLFTMYGKMMQEKNHVGKPFQTLEFLVRDWPYPYDYAFGAEGGTRLLQEILEITPDQPKELQDLRTYIHSCFEKELCFLMPHPGFKVQDPNFNGNICDIDSDFRTYLKQFVSSLLSKDNLTPKIINGQKVKARELYNYFKAYMTVFNSDQIPTPTTIMQATILAGLLSAMNEAREVYEKEMNAVCGPSQPAVPTEDVPDLHNKSLELARTTFTSKKTMAVEDEATKYLEKLNEELNARLPQYEKSNSSKLHDVVTRATTLYEETVNLSKNQTYCLHPLDLEVLHNEATQTAMKMYDENVKKVSSKADQKRTELCQNLENQLAQLKITNDTNNKDVVNELKTEYWEFMESKSVDPPLSEAEFKSSHEAGLKKALSNFRNRRSRPSSYPNDVFKDELEKLIKESYIQLQSINNSKIEQVRIRQEQERRRVEDERLRAEQTRVAEEQARIAREQEAIRLEQEKQRIEQKRIRLELEKQRIEQENQRRHANRRRGLRRIFRW